jgi:general secretion pathway protein G
MFEGLFAEPNRFRNLREDFEMTSRAPRRALRRGFTLMEMLIVLAILVMLVALVVPRFLGAQKKADRQTTKVQVEAFRGALERYALDTRSYPTTEQGLQALMVAPADGEESSTTGWEGPYLNKDEMPKDPWGNDFQYVYPPERGSGDTPDIWSYGPDGEDNTEDDICSWGASSGGEDEFGGDMGEDMDIDVDVDLSPPAGEDF